jgi:hypothetical protein
MGLTVLALALARPYLCAQPASRSSNEVTGSA